MASTADFHNGMVMRIDSDLWAITYFQHVKPGKGGAFVRTKLKNVLTGAVVGDDQLKYLKENMECEGLVHAEKIISVELPNFVELTITDTEPGLRGDTSQGATKPARLETGAVVRVPLFLEQGETIRVDRREDKYTTRV